MKKVALILSGCGQQDGSETHETILTLLALNQAGIKWHAYAPDVNQKKVVDHLSNQQNSNETRSALIEAARLVRGEINPISQADFNAYDAAIIPGGIGAISTLCDYQSRGVDFELQVEVAKFLSGLISRGQPLGFICIAPILIPKLYKKGVKCTIGNDLLIAKDIELLGAKHVNCLATEIVSDDSAKVVSTPANMVAKDIGEVYIGIKKMVDKLVALR